MTAVTLALLAAILLVVVPMLVVPEESIPVPLMLLIVAVMRVLPYALLASQFLGSYLMNVRIKL